MTYRRAEEHKQLLREGLLSEDRWTMSKAIALLLKGGRARGRGDGFNSGTRQSAYCHLSRRRR